LKQPVWFVPGRSASPEGPLARYRPLELVGVAAEYVRRLTEPGDLVLDLFCHGPAFLRETVQAGRRAIGVSVNPISLLVAGLGLEPPPDPVALNAAFTRLADSPKGQVPLRRHLITLYQSRCPVCKAEGIAEWFAWDREACYPYLKTVRCPCCGGVQEGPTDEADIATARRFEPRGLAYHYALNRVAPVGHPARERAAELVELYTPRNLSALMDVTMRLEGLSLARPTRAVLQGLLLSAFDRGSSLDPCGETRPRPRILRPPARFLERNVWLLLEEGLARLVARTDDSVAPVARAPGLSALLGDRASAYVLVPSAAREVRRLLAAHSISLILADPPRPDGVFWALCALWAGWLWDSHLAHAMRPFLRRRRFDWEWHQRALQAALVAAGSLLAPGGHLVTIFAEPDDGLMESVCLAGSGAGYDLVGWGASPGEGSRLVWQRTERVEGRWPEEAQATEEEALAAELAETAADLARGCLRERGEPTPWMVLHAAIYAGLAVSGRSSVVARSPVVAFTADAVRQGLEGLGLEQVDKESDLRWLPALDAGPAVEPLADRVEESVRRTLHSRPAWEVSELILAVYAMLDGPLTPDLPLILLCLDSYGVAEAGVWRLREEDDPARRTRELRSLRKDLTMLGKRLGFQVARGRDWDVRWREGERDVYLFVLSSTAALGRYLLFGPSVLEGARPCLIFPGGRAELLAHKLRRDPRLARAAEEKRWQFIKFRHLRRLIAEGLDRRLFEAVLGLDPIVEREGVQIPLILEGK